MDSSRIAELLLPFLGARSVSHPSPASSQASRPPNLLNSCHSEHREKPAFLSASQLQSILAYIDILLRWNARINLTAIGDPEEIVKRHFGESLFLARLLFPGGVGVGQQLEGGTGLSQAGPEQRQRVQAGQSPAGFANSQQPQVKDGFSDVLDVGSGAGFPGLPIKLWAPHLHLTLIESNHKKVAFLREIVRALTLTNVDVFCRRAEDFSSCAGVVTLRAVERFDVALPVAARLVAPTGQVALLIGRSQVERAIQLAPSLRWSDPSPIPLSVNRVVLLGFRS
jgi:16S rRNA (guanine527-N7)-methyltransferase